MVFGLTMYQLVHAVSHDPDLESSTSPNQTFRSEDPGSYVKINKPTDPLMNQNNTTSSFINR